MQGKEEDPVKRDPAERDPVKRLAASARWAIPTAFVLSLALVGCGDWSSGHLEPLSATATDSATSGSTQPEQPVPTPDAQATAPLLTSSPQNQTVRTGDTVTFSASSSGTAPLAWQWFRDGTPIGGATASIYTLNPSTMTDNGALFTVRVGNAAGETTSAAATLTVQPGPGLELVAGKIGGKGSLDGVGTAALLASPAGLVFDRAGNLFIADKEVHTLRRMTPAGLVTTYAGTALQPGGNDGFRTHATFNYPSALVIDRSDNLYLSDTANGTIRKIRPDGTVSTLAGLAGSPGWVDGNGAAARFGFPTGMAIDRDGNLYLADLSNHVIRKITPAGSVTTLAGTGSPGYADGPGATASLNSPAGLAVDDSGNIYVADMGNALIRKITPDGTVSTLAGTAGVQGDQDGVGTAATFNMPSGLAWQAPGVLYAGEHDGHRLRRISTLTGEVTTVAGGSTKGSADGAATSASFGAIAGIVVDAQGNVLISDSGNATIRRLSSDGQVSTIAGSAAPSTTTDGPVATATFGTLTGLIRDPAGNLIVTDTDSCTVRRISTAGQVTTFLGTNGQCGYADDNGAAAKFHMPLGAAYDVAGNLYVAEGENKVIRRVTPAGDVSTFAGTPMVSGSADGPLGVGQFGLPVIPVFDASGNLFISDLFNHAIRRIAPDGTMTTFAGRPGEQGWSDGIGNQALFSMPAGLAIDQAGNLYVADTGNCVIRRITPAAQVSTVHGTAGNCAGTDGIGSSASFYGPAGLAFDGLGNLYVTETADLVMQGKLRKITPAGEVTTIAGAIDGQIGIRLGTLPGHLSSPRALFAESDGSSVYLVDRGAVIRVRLP